MVGIAFDFRYGTVANASQKTAADAAVGAVRLFPTFDRAALIGVHKIFTRLANYPSLIPRHTGEERSAARFIEIVDELGPGLRVAVFPAESIGPGKLLDENSSSGEITRVANVVWRP